MLVSVCIPTYNGEKYLRPCLESILNQTFTDFEILIVDDFSSDNTLQIANEYSKKDARIRVASNEYNIGLVPNWNRCISLAQGEWIKFVFQDDLIAPNCLEKMLASIKPGNELVFCRRQFLYEDFTPESTKQEYEYNAQIIENIFSKQTEISPQKFCEIASEHIGWNIIGEPTVVMLHRSIFYRFGVFNSQLIHFCDIEFWTRVAIHTGVKYIPEVLATFRVHDSSTTAKNKQFRKFKHDMLDQLILLHDVLFHPAYLPLRAVAAKQHRSVNLSAILRLRNRQAWLVATREPNSPLLTEWLKVIEAYPILKIISKQTFLERILEFIASKLPSLYYYLKLSKQLLKNTI